MWRLAWLRFLMRNCNPLSPEMPRLILARNRLEQRRK
jgi:hypothetical protein